MDGNRRVVAKGKGMVALEATGEKEEKGISSREFQGLRRHSSMAIAIIVIHMVIGNETAPYSTRRWQLDEPNSRRQYRSGESEHWTSHGGVCRCVVYAECSSECLYRSPDRYVLAFSRGVRT